MDLESRSTNHFDCSAHVEIIGSDLTDHINFCSLTIHQLIEVYLDQETPFLSFLSYYYATHWFPFHMVVYNTKDFDLYFFHILVMSC